MKIFSKIKNTPKKVKIYYTLIVVFVFLIIVADPVFAQEEKKGAGLVVETLANGFGWLVYWLASFVGALTTYLLGWLIAVAHWNKFLDVQAVQVGWVLVRDLCNMFFVLLLLVIAFATILRRESYSAQKLLPKLIIFAILINFSKTICGLIIDFGQVIMLTFINGLGDSAGGTFVNVLNIDKMLSLGKFAKDGTRSLEGTGLLMSALGALITYIITAVVVATMMVILIVRVVMLWIYIIMSPIAYLASAFPAGQKYASQWWEEFIKYVTSGPILAFFLWLALKTAEDSSKELGASTPEKIDSLNLGSGKIAIDIFNNAALFQTFIITISLLVGGLIMSQKMGGMAGNLAGKGIGALQKGKGLALKGAKGVVRKVGKVGGAGAAIGTAIAPGVGTVVGAGLGMAARLGARKIPGVKDTLVGKMAQDAHSKEKKRQSGNRLKTLQKLGMGEESLGALDSIIERTGGAFGTGKFGKVWKGATNVMLGTTQSAAKLGTKDIGDAKKMHKGASGTATPPGSAKPSGQKWAENMKEGEWYQSGGLSNKMKHFWNEVSGPGGVDSSNNITEAVKDTDMDSDQGVALAKSLSAYLSKDGKGDASNANIKKITDELLSSRGVDYTVHDTETSVAYRDTGEKKKEGSGKLNVGASFAEGKSNTLAVDFNKLNLSDVDIGGKKFNPNAEGMNVSDKGVKGKIAEQIKQQVKEEKNNLLQLQSDGLVGNHEGAKLSETAFKKQTDNLDKAEKRLENPDKLDNLELVNSAGNNYGLQERKRTVIHERLHSAGINDEEVTETLTQDISEAGTYKDAKELGEMATNLESQNVDPKEIINQLREEILKRRGSRAEQTIKLEEGEIPTDEEFVEEAERTTGFNATGAIKEKIKQPVEETEQKPAEEKGEISSMSFESALEALSKQAQNFEKMSKEPKNDRQEQDKEAADEINNIVNNISQSGTEGIDKALDYIKSVIETKKDTANTPGLKEEDKAKKKKDLEGSEAIQTALIQEKEKREKPQPAKDSIRYRNAESEKKTSPTEQTKGPSSETETEAPVETAEEETQEEKKKKEEKEKEVIASIPEFGAFAKELKEMIGGINTVGPIPNTVTQDKNTKDIAHRLKQLSKAINKQAGATGAIGKSLANMLGDVDDDSTPLEVEVIAKKVSKIIERQEVVPPTEQKINQQNI